MKNTEKRLVREYLNSKCNGGLYGLTISDPEFTKGLYKIIDSIGDKTKVKELIEDLREKRLKEEKRYEVDGLRWK